LRCLYYRSFGYPWFRLNIMKRVWFLTGEPGSGKTKIISKVSDLVRSKGYTVGGIISKEKRDKGIRTGFILCDLSSGYTDIIASTTGKSGPKMGRYRINLNALSNLGVQALLHAAEHSDLIVCDEIGPIELFSPEFKRAIKIIMSSGKPIIGVIHRLIPDPIVINIKDSPDVEIIDISTDPQDDIIERLADYVLSNLER